MLKFQQAQVAAGQCSGSSSEDAGIADYWAAGRQDSAFGVRSHLYGPGSTLAKSSPGKEQLMTTISADTPHCPSGGAWDDSFHGDARGGSGSRSDVCSE